MPYRGLHRWPVSVREGGGLASHASERLTAPFAASVNSVKSVRGIGLLTGGQDKSYALGLSSSLAARGLALDFVGSDELDVPEVRAIPGLTFLNLRGSQQRNVSAAQKVSRVFAYYLRLLRYAATARHRILHILWNNKFEFIDRTFLMLYYKALRKQVVLTSHNVNAAKRDNRDSWLNRFTLRIQYRLADHIFVHTRRMKGELLEDFGVPDRAVTVIPFGINTTVPDTALTTAQARERLQLSPNDRVILFFGRIGPYKGLEVLVSAFQQIAPADVRYRLLIAGDRKTGSESYWDEIRDVIEGDSSRRQVVQKIGYVPDEDTELYFKAADVLVLPYTQIFQSGVLFLSYGFGLPVIAADVGSFGEDIVEGQTGLLFRPGDAADLARAIHSYFSSALYDDLPARRREIRRYADSRYSWDVVADMTCRVYAELVEPTVVKRPA
jgi:glycosyltransferase involved in cell wall biosynthesis